ncbi:MAG: hypothetical protein K8T90_18955 [Planctomycetes bacterium]|nr:hypothetical protein [Planctomycetota bacterium]
MTRRRRDGVSRAGRTGLALAVLAGMVAAGAPARAGDEQPLTGGTPTWSPQDVLKAATWESEPTPRSEAPGVERSALRNAVEGLVGAPVHGRVSFRWEARFLPGNGVPARESDDFDLYTHLDLRVGDEQKDPLSATFSARSAWDIGSRPDGRTGSRWSSLADTYGNEFTTQVYTGYVTWRRGCGPVEAAKIGRQYVYAAETFQFDGVSATSSQLDRGTNLRLLGYAGKPVHFYEAQSSGDWLGGLRATAAPWKGGRAALDYAHVEDDLAGYTNERNDLAAASVWHALTPNVDLHGRFTWLDGPRDALVRATGNFPDQDLLVQVGYKRLLDDQKHLATEFDPYTTILKTLYRYHQADIRAVKGLGEAMGGNWSVEAGAAAKRLVNANDEGTYNRETTRFWLMPSVDDLPWKGSTLSVGGEVWKGNDSDTIRTWTCDLTHRFGGSARLSVGTDYTLYDEGRLQSGERTHLRTAYVRVNAQLSEDLTMDIRYSWERDEKETDHVLSLGLAVEF